MKIIICIIRWFFVLQMRDLHSPNDGIATPELCHEPEYYPVVVIGNGPSGIALSALLSGYWPYYTGQDHADDMLSARLHTAQNEAPGSSLVEQDLQFLADVSKSVYKTWINILCLFIQENSV